MADTGIAVELVAEVGELTKAGGEAAAAAAAVPLDATRLPWLSDVGALLAIAEVH
jgi:hypothetical protein